MSAFLCSFTSLLSQSEEPVPWSSGADESPVAVLPGWAEALPPNNQRATASTAPGAGNAPSTATTTPGDGSPSGIRPDWQEVLNRMQERLNRLPRFLNLATPGPPASDSPASDSAAAAEPSASQPPSAFSPEFAHARDSFFRTHDLLINQVRLREPVPRIENTYQTLEKAWQRWEYSAWPPPASSAARTALEQATSLAQRVYQAWGLFLWSFKMMRTYADPPFHLNAHWQNRAVDFHSFAAVWNPGLARRMEIPFMQDPAAYMEAGQNLKEEAVTIFATFEKRSATADKDANHEGTANAATEAFNELEKSLSLADGTTNP